MIIGIGLTPIDNSNPKKKKNIINYQISVTPFFITHVRPKYVLGVESACNIANPHTGGTQSNAIR